MVLVSMEYAFGRVLNPLGACRIRRISKLASYARAQFTYRTFVKTSVNKVAKISVIQIHPLSVVSKYHVLGTSVR